MDWSRFIPEGHTVAGFTALLGLIYFTGHRLEIFDPYVYATASAWIIGAMGGSGFVKNVGRRLERTTTITPIIPERKTDP